MSKIVIAHLYPEQLNIYGDRGNIIALTKRLEWRGHHVKIDHINPGDKYNFNQADIVFGGGGQDKGQELVAADLLTRQSDLQAAVADGLVVLAICGAYQLLGHNFRTLKNTEIPGIGIFKLTTVGSTKRMIGNIIVDSDFGEIVGFENHSGKTVLEPSQKPLGRVIKGYGNDGRSREEGAIIKNAFGTYMHGPLLPKNPKLADELIRRAIKRRYGTKSTEPLNDTLEIKAAKIAKKLPQ